VGQFTAGDDTRIREAIAAQPTALPRLTRAPGFRRRFDGLSDEAKLRSGFPGASRPITPQPSG
jgi:hypothetical protein